LLEVHSRRYYPTKFVVIRRGPYGRTAWARIVTNFQSRAPRRNRKDRSNKPQRPAMPHSAKNTDEYAAIDLGTNSCRMLIGRAGDNGFDVVDGFSRIVRLGEGLQSTGKLQAPAMDRTVAALRVCAAKIKQRRVRSVRAVATAACRRAANGREFTNRVARETGIDLQLISADLEAELTLKGCAPLFNTGHGRGLLFDIGGGSTEIMWAATPADALPRPLGVKSMPFGVVTLFEEFGDGVLPPDAYEEILRRVDEELAPFCNTHGISEAIADSSVQMVGTSGTVTTLGALQLDLPRYERRRIDGLHIDFSAIKALSARLSEMDLAARRKLPCIGEGRADLMLMGCAVLAAICRRWPIGSLRAADRGIREGLIMEMIEADRTGFSPVPTGMPAL